VDDVLKAGLSRKVFAISGADRNSILIQVAGKPGRSIEGSIARPPRLETV